MEWTQKHAARFTGTAARARRSGIDQVEMHVRHVREKDKGPKTPGYGYCSKYSSLSHRSGKRKREKERRERKVRSSMCIQCTAMPENGKQASPIFVVVRQRVCASSPWTLTERTSLRRHVLRGALLLKSS